MFLGGPYYKILVTSDGIDSMQFNAALERKSPKSFGSDLKVCGGGG